MITDKFLNKEKMKKNWRFFAAFALGAMLSFFGKSFWETMLIIALVAVIIESIIYLMQKKETN